MDVDYNYTNENMSMLKNLFDTKVFSDVTLLTEDKVLVNAHRFILSSRSKTLKNLLMIQDYGSHLTVECIRSDVMMLLLEFMYTGHTNIEQDKVGIFIEAARYLKLNTEIGINEMEREENNFVKAEIIESDKSFQEFKVEETAFVNTDAKIVDREQNLLECDIEIDREENNFVKTETIESDNSFHEFKVEEAAFVNTDTKIVDQEQMLLEYNLGLASTREELETPSTMCDADVKLSHICKKCKRKFKSESKFKIHTRLCISLGSQRPFKCNDCGSAFRENYHLQLHQKPINRCNQLPTKTPKSSFESFMKKLKRKE